MRFGIAIAVAAIAGSLYLILPSPVSIANPSAAVAANTEIMPATARDAARAVNAYRRSRGRGRVRINAKLNQAAEAYAKKLARADRISHTLGGSTLPKRLSAAGYDWGSAAENLGGGYKSIDEAMKGWRTSKKGHNAILLRREAREMGFALVTRKNGRYKSFWVLIMARKRSPGEGLEYREVPH